jgi:hypothetical protein
LPGIGIVMNCATSRKNDCRQYQKKPLYNCHGLAIQRWRISRPRARCKVVRDRICLGALSERCILYLKTCVASWGAELGSLLLTLFFACSDISMSFAI